MSPAIDSVPSPKNKYPLGEVPSHSIETQPAPLPPAALRPPPASDIPLTTATEAPIDTTPTAEILPARSTTDLAVRDVRLVLEVQREQNQLLTTKLNILFVASGALLTTLSISRLAMTPSPFTVVEVLGFLINFTLLVQAFLPRQVAVTPNLEDRKVLERYLGLDIENYQLQMLVNLAETYHINKQRLDDVSATLRYSAYATWIIAVTILLHMVTLYFFS
jgi:hypothetical protein